MKGPHMSEYICLYLSLSLSLSLSVCIYVLCIHIYRCNQIKRVAIYYLNTEAVCLRHAIHHWIHLFSKSVNIYIYIYTHMYVYICIINIYNTLVSYICLSHIWHIFIYVFDEVAILLFVQHV